MRLYLDACAIIYAIEGAEPFHSAVLRRVTEVESLTDGVLLTSRLSLLLRAAHNVKTADSIHVASAQEAQADVLLTGDAGLARCPGIRVDVL